MIAYFFVLVAGSFFCWAIYCAQKEKAESNRLLACGLASYIPKVELQKALDFENARARKMSRINVEMNRHHGYWLDRGRQMGILK